MPIKSPTKRLQFESKKLNGVVNKMKVFFATKDENNKRREEDFLKLSPGERLIAFIEMISAQSELPFPFNTEHPNSQKNNFVIYKKR